MYRDTPPLPAQAVSPERDSAHSSPYHIPYIDAAETCRQFTSADLFIDALTESLRYHDSVVGELIDRPTVSQDAQSGGEWSLDRPMKSHVKAKPNHCHNKPKPEQEVGRSEAEILAGIGLVTTRGLIVQRATELLGALPNVNTEMSLDVFRRLLSSHDPQHKAAARLAAGTLHHFMPVAPDASVELWSMAFNHEDPELRKNAHASRRDALNPEIFQVSDTVAHRIFSLANSTNYALAQSMHSEACELPIDDTAQILPPSERTGLVRTVVVSRARDRNNVPASEL